MTIIKAIVRCWSGPEPLPHDADTSANMPAWPDFRKNANDHGREPANPADRETRKIEQAAAAAAATCGRSSSGRGPSATCPSSQHHLDAPSDRQWQYVAAPGSAQGLGAGIGLLKIPSLDMLPGLVAANSTVFFDLDETLVRRQESGTHRPLVLTEPNAAHVVQQLQKRRDVHVVGLTARPFYRDQRDCAKGTETSLRKLGIDLSRDTKHVGPLGEQDKGPVGFRKGCGYTGSRITKGAMLKHLQCRLPMTKIIFVDDRADNLHDVALFAASSNIPCLAVLYTGALDSLQQRARSKAWQDMRDVWCQVGASCVLVEQHK